MEQVVVQHQADNLDSTYVLSRTAYYLAKSDRPWPYDNHPHLLDLQHLVFIWGESYVAMLFC